MVASYFLDTSALVKRYIPEVGTPWIQSLTHQTSGNILIIARITVVEIMSAIARRQRESTLTPEQAHQLRTICQQHFLTQYQIVELTPNIATMAGKLCNRQSLRAYDAVQLASAISILPIVQQMPNHTLTFLTADDRLLKAAQTEHLQAVNPNYHRD
jgi:uncharacterized protein